MTEQYHEPELHEPVLLCQPDGRLNRAAVGWSRTPLHTCNLNWDDSGLRPKRWNYWCITGTEFLMHVALSDRGLVAVGSTSFLDFETNKITVVAGETPFARGVVMPEQVRQGLTYQHPDIELDFREVSPTETILRVKCPDFGGEPMQAELHVTRSLDQETLNVVIPWSDERFQFTSKQECLPASGVIQIGNRQYTFEHGRSFATLDYGRGFWPHEAIWNWAAASGVQSGHLVGLNLGGKWTDGTGMNENGFFIDGVLTKIHEDLVWEYDTQNWMKPWRIHTSHSDLLDVTLVPFFDNYSRSEIPEQGYVRRVNQLFGYFHGSIRAPNGERIAISDLLGWAEELTATW